MRLAKSSTHARNFLGQWDGKLVCDDFAGYKASSEQGITEIGCMAHARRKFFDLHATNKSQLTEQAINSIGGLYEIERQAREMTDEDRWRIRQEKAAPIIDALHTWMMAQRDLVPGGSAIAKAMGTWALELVGRRVTTQRKAGSRDHELDPVGTHEWA